ncbi:UPF0280 family protein [Desulforhopalus singaporensis]|uniref:Uncharacterized protein n=1 Tax=Desulforhopalus singaporensis TaxID=91360 RepID=A0A1H0JM09_9BACT|nr:UPF0280 family protein [Desulforhopalus singaporensis]SDO44827.1 hypothetical protein SAMN05660330_00250 [Desulforhopalus singaporensis]
MMKKRSFVKPLSYVERFYRDSADSRSMVSVMVKVKDTDLHILADRDVSKKAQELALQYRLQIEDYIRCVPRFEHSLTPLSPDPLAPPIVKAMLKAGEKTGTGPMAAVAGSIAEFVGTSLLKSYCSEIIVENGGDLFVKKDREATVAIFAGESPLSMRVGVRIGATKMPTGICTSSGTVGHSLSFGRADSVTVIARSTPLADGAATRLGNEVGRERDVDAGIKRALDASRLIDGLSGIIVVCGDKLGAVGDVELVRLGSGSNT